MGNWTVNPRMWRGGNHEYNPDTPDSWSFAHVINSIVATGSVPAGRLGETKDILNYVLTDLINNQRELAALRKSYVSAIKAMTDAHDSINRGDVLRAKTVIINWNLEDRVRGYGSE